MSAEILRERLERRLVVVANPVSSRAGEVVSQLDSLGIKYEYVPTHETEEGTAEQIYENLGEGDLPIYAGGDGTAGRIANALMDPEGIGRGLHRLPAIFYGEGYANDLAAQLNGRRHLGRILTAEYETDIYPMRAIASKDGEPVLDRYAIAYIGGGGVALAAAAVDGLKQGNRLVRIPPVRRAAAAVLSLQAGAEADRFTADDLSTLMPPDVATNFILANGSRMAIHGRLHADLRESSVEIVNLDAPGKVRTFLGMVALAQGRLPGITRPRHSMRLDTREGIDRIPVQFDGDALEIPSGAVLSVSYPDGGIRVIAPELGRKPQ